MKQYLLISALACMVALSSCKKDNDVTAPVKKATNINELNPSPSFKWSTTKSVTLNVTGQPVPVEIKHVLKVKDQNGILLFSIYHKMNQDLTIKFDIPADVNKVTVEYGKISKPIDIAGNIIKFKFSPEIGNED